MHSIELLNYLCHSYFALKHCEDHERQWNRNSTFGYRYWIFWLNQLKIEVKM